MRLPDLDSDFDYFSLKIDDLAPLKTFTFWPSGPDSDRMAHSPTDGQYPVADRTIATLSSTWGCQAPGCEPRKRSHAAAGGSRALIAPLIDSFSVPRSSLLQLDTGAELMSLTDKNIVVTGGNRGIGQALVEEALRRGANPTAHLLSRPTKRSLD